MKNKMFCLFSLLLLLSACGKEAMDSEKNMPEEVLRQETGEDSAEPANVVYDFWEETGASAEGGEYSLTFATGMKIVFPEEWRDKIVTSVEPGLDYVGDTLFVSEKKNAAAGAGGHLFSIGCINRKIADAMPYEIFPAERVLGVYRHNGEEYAFIFSLPREMVWVEGDQEMERAYQDVLASVDKVQIITDGMEGFTECGKDDLDWIIDFQ